MQVWNLLHGARCKYRTQKVVKKSPSGHHRATLSGYIFATRARIDNWKKLVMQQYLLQMLPQYGQLWPTSGWDRFQVWGTPANFNRFRVLAASLHGTPVLGVSQTLRHWTEGATYIRQGGHHVGHWPTFYLHLCYCEWGFISHYVSLLVQKIICILHHDSSVKP